MWPSQTSSQGGWGSGGASLADLTAAPSPLLSQELQQRWEESKRDAESFYAYVSNEHRSAYMTKVARITLKNFEENKRDRLRGIANEKRLDRKGNLLESGGLWIVDDQLRAQLARKYQMEQDGEVTATTAASGDAKKGGGETPGEDATARDTASAPVSEEEAMLQRFMAQRKSQELSFASVPEEFMSIDDDVAVMGAQDGGDETPRLRSTARSPELLLLCSRPRIVASQLLHHAASSTAKRSLSSSCASLDVLGHSQGDVIPTGDEPPRKMVRHAYRQK
ncbi:hypothetical protein DQ04_05751000 [Trypanosoma grayi]|uniref:hypothetical protein n=1 Tax=Trypanosoma grayi TaxID=71804 RepID=UPI0004F45F07|nr:hypothetical protein DQ04_05751000 [Trypanosoma grayi]KEG09131.1 hypothetical protein DQ04_05751000 [Trypanosoma grayi]